MGLRLAEGHLAARHKFQSRLRRLQLLLLLCTSQPRNWPQGLRNRPTFCTYCSNYKAPTRYVSRSGLFYVSGFSLDFASDRAS